MPDFGVTDAGFVLPTQQQLLALMAADEKATIGPNVDTSSDSVLGQLNGVATRQLMIAYEALEVAYNSNDPDAVEGLLQTALGKITGTPRLGASKSTVILNCVLDAGTILLAGITVASIVGKPDSQWTPAADYTALTTDTLPVPFESTATGPSEAAAGDITVMTTTVVGWNGVTNPGDAVPGRNVESDEDLEIRREQELAGGGAGNTDAIRAALLKITDSSGHFILSATVLNNVTDSIDANGLPPHSTEAVIWDGPGAPISNDTIAQVLWDKGAAGTRTFGALIGTAKDALGNPQVMSFSRVTQVPIFLAFALTARTGYVGDDAFKIALAAACNGDPVQITPSPGFTAPEETAFGLGDDVDPYDVVMNTAGLGAKVVGAAAGLTAPGTPSSIDPAVIAIGVRQIAIFDTSRIDITTA